MEKTVADVIMALAVSVLAITTIVVISKNVADAMQELDEEDEE